MKRQRCQAASAVLHRAKPNAGNGEARPNTGRSARTNPRDRPNPTARRTPHVIRRGFQDDPLDARNGAGTQQSLCAGLNPHRDRGTT